MTEKKKGRWLLPASLVVILAVVAAAMIGAVTRAKPLPTPREALEKAVDSLEPLPDPVTIGVLGQGKMDGERFGVSGNLNLQTDKDGLALSLTDFTLGYEEGSTDLEVYINSEAAAVRIPELLGETWYGVDLSRDLEAQAIEAAGEELVDWYFSDGELSEAQATMSKLRTALIKVRELGLSDGERSALRQTGHALSLVQVDGGYTLSIAVNESGLNTLLGELGLPQRELPSPLPPPEEQKIIPIDCSLDLDQRLTALDITADGFQCYLDLGDPDEPTPRLELQWGENQANSLELAFTISDGTPLTAPKFHSAFDLLNLLSLGE